MKICNLEPNSPSLTQSFLGSRCVTTLHSPRYLLVSPTWVHWTVFHSKTYENKGSATKHTYRFIFSALWPVEPFHHCAGCHLFPLHAGDAEQLHGLALHSLCLGRNFNTYRTTKTSWGEGAAEKTEKCKTKSERHQLSTSQHL